MKNIYDAYSIFEKISVLVFYNFPFQMTPKNRDKLAQSRFTSPSKTTKHIFAAWQNITENATGLFSPFQHPFIELTLCTEIDLQLLTHH
ncbi:hypothetical protein [Flavivirga eckloniae]|uniref:Uncharacterized protein n=1 Tax=Flavivirga eckloniae TaxID=1803846 RepID=A0A2K9PTQ4_9FLAO|nr:hypothetical protein [Flavivirga eckloniae]AUP80443.1 hypothetical protein C1H87_17680 [Flavivirga eckloniae]